MASISISISASKPEEADNAQETDELAIAQKLAQKLMDDGYTVTGSFYGTGGTTPLTGTATETEVAETDDTTSEATAG